MPNPAAVMYEAYRKHVNQSGLSSVYLIAWEYLTAHEKEGWHKAVAAFVNLTKKETEEEINKALEELS